MDDILAQYLAYYCGAANVKRNEPLSRWTTMRVGGPAQYFVQVPTPTALCRVINGLNFLNYPYFVLGLGANVLASDQGYHGVVLKLDFREIMHNDQFLYADAGAKLGVVVNYAQAHGLAGFAWATGIPATVGGAVYMNCGAFGHSMQDVVILVDVLVDGQRQTWTVNQLQYGYRHSVLMTRPAVVLGAYFRLTPAAPTQIAADMQDILQRRAHHPKLPSAGSIFKRPRDDFYVGRTIEALGLKNYQIGGAKISPEHAGFIVNTGHATCQDVLDLIAYVQQKVQKATDVMLETEVIYLGQDLICQKS